MLIGYICFLNSVDLVKQKMFGFVCLAQTNLTAAVMLN